MTQIIEGHPGDTLTFKVKRQDEMMKIAVTPEKVTKQGQTFGRIGTYQPRIHSVLGTLKFGVTQTATVTVRIFDAVGKLITGQYGIDALAGPVGIVHMTGKVVNHGVLALMTFAAFLSINVGIFNLLPIPALDGGRLVFLLIEGVRGKPIDPNKEALVHFVGFALIFLLLIVVTWNDIQKLFS